MSKQSFRDFMLEYMAEKGISVSSPQDPVPYDHREHVVRENGKIPLQGHIYSSDNHSVHIYFPKETGRFWGKYLEERGESDLLAFALSWLKAIKEWASVNLPRCESFEAVERWRDEKISFAQMMSRDGGYSYHQGCISSDDYKSIEDQHVRNFFYSMVRASALLIQLENKLLKYATGICMYLQDAVYQLGNTDLWKVTDKAFEAHQTTSIASNESC